MQLIKMSMVDRMKAIVTEIISLEPSIHAFNDSNMKILHQEQYEVWCLLDRVHLQFKHILQELGKYTNRLVCTYLI